MLSIEDEAVVVAFRKHTLLPLDDCLYALQATIPHLTRSSLHRCLQRHGISQLPQVDGDITAKKKFKAYPIGYVHIDIAEVQTAEGKLYLFVAIDRRAKFAFVQLVRKTGRTSASAFLEALIRAVPYKIRTVLTDNGIQFTFPRRYADGPTATYMTHMFDMRCRENNIEHRLTKVKHPWTNGQVERMNRTIKEATQGSDGQALPLRQSPATRKASARLHRRLQLRPATENAEGAHTVRVHLQALDSRAQSVHGRSAPPNAGTKHLVRQWARKGSRSCQPADQRYENAYLFGAVCPARSIGAALAMPSADTEAMQAHLDEISQTVRRRAHAVLLLDRAGWHTTGDLVVSKNISLVFLPPRSPELGPGGEHLVVPAGELAVEPHL